MSTFDPPLSTHRPAAANDPSFPPSWRAAPGSARGRAMARLRLSAARFAPPSVGREPRLPRLAGAAVPPPTLQDGVRRVPASAFVTIGRRSGLGRSANDNRPRTSRARPLWRDLLLLLLLAVTVAGAFYSGRLHAGYKVIVVPGPSSSRSVVT